jgi:hypothetical protein
MKAGVKLSGGTTFDTRSRPTCAGRARTRRSCRRSSGTVACSWRLKVYDHVSTTDLVARLASVAGKLSPKVPKNGAFEVN